MTIDDEYIELVNKLSEKLTGDDPAEHIRRVVRQEIGKRTDALVGFVIFCGALWWAGTYAKPDDGWLVIGLGVAWLIFLTTRWDRDPSTDRHLIVMNAEDRNRLHVIAETYEAGEQVWAVEEQSYGKRERTVVAVDNPTGKSRGSGSIIERLNWRRLDRLSDGRRCSKPRRGQKQCLSRARLWRSARTPG